MKTRSLQLTLTEVHTRKGVLIDVREPKEFSDYHIEGSINLPASGFHLNQFLPYKDATITLICQTGNRAGKVYNSLLEHGFEDVHVLEEHIAHINSPSMVSKTTGWTVDRQFRMTLGVLLAFFLVGYHTLSHWFMVIPGILATGLIITSIIDRCYMRMGIAMLPWNRGKKV